VKIFPVTLFKEFIIAACVSKSYSEKITYENDGKQKQKFDVLELVNVFKEASKI
jgi:hypothetical protein